MPIPVISVAQMREWEQSSWTAGCSVAAVIRRVGEILAARASRLTRDGDFILLLAGKGHNGDDARAAQPHLANRRVEILNVENPAADFAALENLLAQKPALIVDALFGIGVNRVLDAGWKKFIARVNDSRARVLAVDVPSGLNADNGETFGAAIVATHTLTLGAVKRGLLATAAAQFTGRVELAREIGLLPRAHKSEINWILPDDFAGFPPVRNAASHKGSHGHVALVAGSAGYHGAAVLAAP
jgi:NAD(P)H-hydrate epimerase